MTPVKFPIQSVPPEALHGDEVKPGDPRFGIIWINPERMSGAPCFFATRVPIQHLWDYLQDGATLEEFLQDFDGVERAQVIAVMEMARRATSASKAA